VADPNSLVLDPAEQFPSGFGQADLVRREQFVRALEKNGRDFAPVGF
jgi:hypothetical protein